MPSTNATTFVLPYSTREVDDSQYINTKNLRSFITVSQYSTVVLTVVRVMIDMYTK